MAPHLTGPLPYIGGKRRIARRLIPLFPVHTTYVEPFAGGAQVFFHKPRSRIEVLNDLDDEIVNFLRMCQRHPQELARLLRWQPASRRLFDTYLHQSPQGLTDLERAQRFYYLQKNCWSGRRTRQHFHYHVTKPGNHRPDQLSKTFAAVAARLDRVQLEHGPYEEVLSRYDRPTTLFYCDPPYIDIDLYPHTFRDADFQTLAARLATLKGRFLLSINDCDKARQWFREFHCLPIAFTYTAMRTPRVFQELLFANFPLPDTLPVP